MAKDSIGKIIAMAQERQDRHYKFGEDEEGVPLAITLVQDAGKQMLHKNYAAAYECMECALDEQSKVL